MPTSARAMGRISMALKDSTDANTRLIKRPRFHRALLSGSGAIAVLVISQFFVHGTPHTVSSHLTSAGFTLGFLILAVLCVRAIASELDEFFSWRGGHTAGSAVRMMVTIAGYLMAALGALGMVSVPVGHLLVGGAIAGVVLGIAAQQSLGNVFAGLVLLVARPFGVRDHIRVRSGALGGEFSGTVISMSLTYVAVSTDEGLLKVPNSGMLAAAVGPWRRDRAAVTQEDRLVTTGAGGD